MKLASLAVALLLSANITLASDMCTNSHEIICKNAKAETQEQDKFLEELAKRIRKEAAPRIQARAEAALKNIAKFRLIKRALTLMRIEQQEIMRVAQESYPEINALLSDKTKHEELKSYLKTAIETTDFSTEVKAEMQRTLSAVQIISFEEYIDIFAIDESLIKNMNANACGTDGLETNAFAYRDPQKQNANYVVICPGLALQSQVQANQADPFRDIIFVVAHELGHHLDNRTFGNKVYANYLACIANDHAQELVLTKKTEKTCKKSSITECRVANTLTHAQELISDVWGFKAVNAYRNRNGYNIVDTENLLKSNLQFLCGSLDYGVHPSGHFRLGVHLQVNQDAKEALSCQDSQLRTCSF